MLNPYLMLVLFEKERYGNNKMPEMSHKSIFQHWFEAIQDTTMLILCGAAVVSIGTPLLPPRIFYYLLLLY